VLFSFNARTIDDNLVKLFGEDKIAEFLDMTEVKQAVQTTPILAVDSPMSTVADTPLLQRFPSTTRRKSVFAEGSSPASNQQLKKENERRKSMFNTFRQKRAEVETEPSGNVKSETREKLISILPGLMNSL
jgi:hypothetical protein